MFIVLVSIYYISYMHINAIYIYIYFYIITNTKNMICSILQLKKFSVFLQKLTNIYIVRILYLQGGFV